jgi:hypothetical protein
MIRLNSLRTFGLTADPTWDNIPATFWSTLETTTAIFCACMPSIRAGLLKFFPKALGYTTHPISTSAGTGDRLKSASHGRSDTKSIPLSTIEKLEPQPISSSPLNLHTKPSEAAAEDDATGKELTVQIHDFATAKRVAYEELNKPLPLTPTTKFNLALSISTTASTETEDRRDDIEKFAGTGNSPRASDDTSRLV